MRALLLLPALAACGEPPCDRWTQWGADPEHRGAVCAEGQPLERVLARIQVDPFAREEAADADGDLLVHYAAPVVVGDDLYATVKTGAYTPCIPPVPPAETATCAPYRWHSEVWTVERHAWVDGRLERRFRYESDWKPAPTGGFQPAFQPVVCGESLWLPGASGSVLRVERKSGQLLERLAPLGADPDTYLVGSLVADRDCTLYYSAVKLDHDQPFTRDAQAWLVRVSPEDGAVRTQTFAALTAGRTPGPEDRCRGTFTPDGTPRPWPPPDQPDGSPTLPGSFPCLSQRPVLGAAPAIREDGTVFLVSRAHASSRYAYLLAVNPDLTLRFATSLRDLLADGCGHTVPADGDTGARRFNCRPGARDGVDPATNEAPAARALDDSSASPVVLPDGGVLYGAYTAYNGFRGHLLKFDGEGRFQAAHDFGWDTTPAVWSHDDTYSVIIKDNSYGVDEGGTDLGPFYIVQLDRALRVEWRYQHQNAERCRRTASGALECVADHPNGFEWCINAPAVDKNGVVYASAEDGNAFAIGQGGVERGRVFLEMAIAAAYTPLSIDDEGRIYAQNDGFLSILGSD